MTGSTPSVRRLDLGQQRQPYVPTWELQRSLHAQRVAHDIDDTVLLLEHEPVYTAGRRTASFERPLPGTTRGADVVDVDRGGKITWHGPGQLVGYPLVALPEPMDVVAFVRQVEGLLIDVCADLGLEAMRVPGRSGVWRAADSRGPERKVAAIGIRVSRGVTMHGFAINADCDLSWFSAIVPCGITDAGVTSLSAELGRDVSVLEVADLVEQRLALGALVPVDARVPAEAAQPGART
jgi:lipoyl(octanoyl) transferase